MRIIPDQLRSKNLVPFKKRNGRYKIPGLTKENEVLMDHVDADLSTEEQTYVRHYLGYADALIRGAEENALPGPSEADSRENGLPAEKPLNHQSLDHQSPNHQSPNQQSPNQQSPNQQPPADQPAAASLVEESSSAKSDRPATAA
jgi:hypothetical protein